MAGVPAECITCIERVLCPIQSEKRNHGGLSAMRKLVLAALAVSITAFPAAASGPGYDLTACICKVHIVIEGKQFHLRKDVDFRMRRSPYGEVVVNLKRSIEMDSRWAHARPAISSCLSSTVRRRGMAI